MTNKEGLADCQSPIILTGDQNTYKFQVKHERTDGRTTSALCPSFLEVMEAVQVVSNEQEHLLVYFDI